MFSLQVILKTGPSWGSPLPQPDWNVPEGEHIFIETEITNSKWQCFLRVRIYDYWKGKIISEMEFEFSALDNKSTASEYLLDFRKFQIYNFHFRLHGIELLG